MKFFLLILVAFLFSGCDSPLLNEAEKPKIKRFDKLGPNIHGRLDKKDQNEEEQPEEQEKNQIDHEDWGCPFYIDSFDLCFEITWFDHEGAEVSQPIYYAEDFWEKSMSAHFYFWPKGTNQLIDPVTEFDEVKFIGFKMWMPTHGHGSDIPVVEFDENNRVFKVSGLAFIMDCDPANPWWLKVQLKSEDEEDDYFWAEDPHVLDQETIVIDELEVR